MRSGWPDKLTSIKAFGVKRKTNAIMPEDLSQITAATAKDIEIANMGIALQLLLNLQRKTMHAAPHIGVAGGDPDVSAGARRHHCARHSSTMPSETGSAAPWISTRAFGNSM